MDYQLTMDLPKDEASAFKTSQSANTRRNYQRATTAFAEWCGARGLTAMPATPQTVADYLADMAGRGWRPATLRATRAAVANAHRQAGREDPTASRKVKEKLARLVREDDHPQTRTSGLTAEVMAQIRTWACRPRRLGRGSRLEFEADATSRGLVDIAIASVMRDAMLRPSEATALRWEDVESLLDGAGQIHIHRDSADQEIIFIGPDAVRDLQAIRPAGDVPKEHVFGLVAETISRRLKAAAAAAGVSRGFLGNFAKGRHGPRSVSARSRHLGADGCWPVEVAGHAGQVHHLGSGRRGGSCCPVSPQRGGNAAQRRP